MALAKGIYRVGSRLKDSQCLDIAGFSGSDYANAQLFQSNDTNNQKAYLDIDSGGNTTFRFVHSAKMLDLSGGLAQPGRNIQQYHQNNTRAQDWVLADSGQDLTTNGVSLDCYFIKSKKNTGYVIDAESGQNRNGTNLQLYPLNSTPAQQWCFHKDSYLHAKAAVPADIGAVFPTDTARTSSRGTVGVTASTTVFPSWLSSSSKFQMRWRYRGRLTGTDEWSGYSRWYAPDGAFTDEGWGNAWNANVAITSKGQFRKSTTALAVGVDQGTYDRKQFQIEVRTFGFCNWAGGGGISIPYHSYSHIGTVDAVWQPTLRVSSVTFSMDGLMIAYASDFNRGDNSLTIDRLWTPQGYLTQRSIPFKNLDAVGTITIPFAELTFIPDENERVVFSGRLSTIDTSRQQQFDTSISYDANHGVSVSVTQTVQSGYEVLAHITGSFTEAECHIVYRQDDDYRISQCDALADGFRVIPPLDKDYSLFVRVKGTGDVWGTCEAAGIKVPAARKHLLNYDEDFFELTLSESPFTNPSRSVEKNYDTFLLNGNSHESIYFGTGVKSDITLEGIIPIDDTELGSNASYSAFTKLAASDYATYRSPYGDCRPVAILGYSIDPLAPGFMKVSLSLKERT